MTDPERLQLRAHVDQTRSRLRDMLRGHDPQQVAALVKRCAKGELGGLGDRERLLVGLLATVCIFDLETDWGDDAD